MSSRVTPGSSALLSGHTTAPSSYSSSNPWKAGSSAGSSPVQSNASLLQFRKQKLRPCCSRSPIALTHLMTLVGIGMAVKDWRLSTRPEFRQKNLTLPCSCSFPVGLSAISLCVQATTVFDGSGSSCTSQYVPGRTWQCFL